MENNNTAVRDTKAVGFLRISGTLITIAILAVSMSMTLECIQEPSFAPGSMMLLISIFGSVYEAI